MNKMAIFLKENAFCVGLLGIFIGGVSGSHFSYTKNLVRRGRDSIYTKIAKNLDVMGFEPMTSGLEPGRGPASLTTGSNGSLIENGRG